MTDSESSASDTKQKDTEFPPGLKLPYIISWMFGRRKRGMVANPRGFRESARPPYHFHPAPSPHLVPRLMRPLWVVFYYVPLWLKQRYVATEIDREEGSND